MKKNRLQKLRLLKDKGFSLVEIMITVGLLSVVTFVGVKQSGLISNSMTNMSLDRQIDEMFTNMTSLVMKKQVCEATFQGPIPKSDYTLIENTPYEVDGVYLDGKVEITSIETKLINNNPFLEVGLRKLKEKASSKSITRRIPLLANLNLAMTHITDCFSLTSSIDNTVKYEVARRICENTYGPAGVPPAVTKFDQMFDGSDPLNPTCSFDGFVDNFELICPNGESITRINYNSNTMAIEPVCSGDPTAAKPFEDLNCENNWIKKVRANGTFECASLTDYVDDDSVLFNAGDICNLKIDNSTNKVKLHCLQSLTDGVCDTTTAYSCSAGISNNSLADSTSHYLWSCDGVAGGSSANCSMPRSSGYAWNEGPWGACTMNGSGVNEKSRTVTCQDSGGAAVADSNCSSPKPATTSSSTCVQSTGCTYPSDVADVNECHDACPSGPTYMYESGSTAPTNGSQLICPFGSSCYCAASGPSGGPVGTPTPTTCEQPTCSSGLTASSCGNGPGDPPQFGSIYICDQGNGLHYWCVNYGSGGSVGGASTANACITAAPPGF